MTTSSAQYMSLPFDEAIAFFRQKVSLPTKRWDDLWAGMHARGFVVAGAVKAELLGDLRSAVDKAISTGTTLAEFRKDFDKVVSSHGWKYKGGRGWRSAVIYNTNLSTAYAAGRWQQMTDPDVVRARPYLRYVASSSANKRPEHVAWYNTVLSADHPWWKTHYPPNGWGCKCGAVSMSAREVERFTAEGKKIKTEPPPAETVDYPHRQTGEVLKVPKGIDPGWDYNVGEAAWGRRLSDNAMDEWRARGRNAWEQLTAGDWQTHGRPKMIPVDKTSVSLGPKLTTKDAAEQALTKILGNEEKIFQITGPGGYQQSVLVNAGSLAGHIDLERTPFLPLLPEILQKPYEVWLSFERHKGTGQVALRQRFVGVLQPTGDKKRGMVVVAQARNGILEAWTMVPARNTNYLQAQRVGMLVYAREE